jgi:hypothetical protein
MALTISNSIPLNSGGLKTLNAAAKENMNIVKTRKYFFF